MREPASLDDWLAALRGQGWQGKKVGQEWVGPCPLCGGDDRFHVKEGTDVPVLASCRKGCSFEDILKKVSPDGSPGPGRMAPPDWGPTPETDEKDRAAMEQLRKRWADAQDPKEVHPYFAEKGYTTNPLGVKVDRDGETLLVPMPALGIEGNPLHGLHRIWRDGKRWVKKHAYGSKPNGTYFLIGGDRLKTGRAYIVEGIATGMAISRSVKGRAIDGVVVVAFVRGNLGHVAKALKGKYPKWKRVIGADDDRWKTPGENPGVESATKAAREHDCELCIPEFEDTATQPTDFDDLLGLEGPEAVRHCLDPKRAPKAVTSVPQPESDATEVVSDAPRPESDRNEAALPPPGALPPPEADADPLHGMYPEVCDLADQVGHEGWTEPNCDKLDELLHARRELDVDGPPPPRIQGRSVSEALKELEQHFKEHGPPEPDPCFEDDGKPRGLVVDREWSATPGERKWVLSRPWGPAGSVVLFTGRGAGGKTQLSMQLAMAIAAGRSEIIPVAGDDSQAPQVVAAAGKVVVVGWEQTADDARRTVQGIAACGGPDAAEVGDRLLFVSALDLGFGPLWAPRGDGSGHVATRGELTKRARKLFEFLKGIPDLRAIVLDPLASVYASDENNRALVREFLDHLIGFAANHPSKPLILLVGHPAKAIKGDAAVYSGSTDWRNAPRAVVTLKIQTSSQHAKPLEGETNQYVVLELEKANYGPHPIPIPLASQTKGEDQWRWIEARSIDQAVRNYAAVRGLEPAALKSSTTTERQPKKHEKVQLYAAERLADSEGASMMVDEVNEDYSEWHRSRYGDGDNPIARNTFNRAMKEAGREVRYGQQKKGPQLVKNCRFTTSADVGGSGEDTAD